MGRTLAQRRYCPVRQCPVFSLYYLEASLLVLPAIAPSDLCLSGILYFHLGVLRGWL